MGREFSDLLLKKQAEGVQVNLIYDSFLSREFDAEMEKTFAKDLVESHQINWEEWKERLLFSKMRELFAHLFDHWL